MYVLGEGSVNLTNCSLTSNSASLGGAAALDGDGKPLALFQLDGCNLVGNSAATTGSALFCLSDGACTLANSYVAKCPATAIFAMFNARVDIRSTLLELNRDPVSLYGARGSLRDVTIARNNGTAVFAAGSSLSVTASVVRGNSGHGLWFNGGDNTTISDSFISGNSGTGTCCVLCVMLRCACVMCLW